MKRIPVIVNRDSFISPTDLAWLQQTAIKHPELQVGGMFRYILR